MGVLALTDLPDSRILTENQADGLKIMVITPSEEEPHLGRVEIAVQASGAGGQPLAGLRVDIREGLIIGHGETGFNREAFALTDQFGLVCAEVTIDLREPTFYSKRLIIKAYIDGREEKIAIGFRPPPDLREKYPRTVIGQGLSLDQKPVFRVEFPETNRPAPPCLMLVNEVDEGDGQETPELTNELDGVVIEPLADDDTDRIPPPTPAMPFPPAPSARHGSGGNELAPASSAQEMAIPNPTAAQLLRSLGLDPDSISETVANLDARTATLVTGINRAAVDAFLDGQRQIRAEANRIKEDLSGIESGMRRRLARTIRIAKGRCDWALGSANHLTVVFVLMGATAGIIFLLLALMMR